VLLNILLIHYPKVHRIFRTEFLGWGRRATRSWQQASQWTYDPRWQYQVLLPTGVLWALEMLSTSCQLENLR